MKRKELEWNPDEAMNKEYALSVVESAKQFIRARYYMPNVPAFNGEEDFNMWMRELDGLKAYIINNSEG